ncbi:MAG: hypothetical protein ACRDDX_02885 [Cellulosilyticaceae bacterium]
MSKNCVSCFDELIGHKVMLHTCRARTLVIVCEVCTSYMKVLAIGTGNTHIVNLDAIDYIEVVPC